MLLCNLTGCFQDPPDPLQYQAGGGSILALPPGRGSLSRQRLSGGRSGQTQPGLRHRPREDQHVQVQRPQGGRRPQEEHDGEDEESEPDESVTDVTISVRSEVTRQSPQLIDSHNIDIQEPPQQTQWRMEDVCQ